jgi:hypothetical protein
MGKEWKKERIGIMAKEEEIMGREQDKIKQKISADKLYSR